jgi:hypothetical protein
MRILTFVSLIVLIIGCKEASKKEAGSKIEPAPSTISVQKSELRGMTQEEFIEIQSKCNAVDYIFHSLPFSINQNDKASVLTNLGFIGAEQADAIPANCKALGREFFQAEGEIFLEADLYYCPPDHFSYVFFKDNKAFAANKMSTDGINFYSNLIRQITAKPSGS